MTGKLTEPRVITDYRQEPVCILPAGFYLDDARWEQLWLDDARWEQLWLDDARWEQLWARYDEKGESLTHDDLRFVSG
jgi:hypothetical protein